MVHSRISINKAREIQKRLSERLVIKDKPHTDTVLFDLNLCIRYAKLKDLHIFMYNILTDTI